MISKEEVASVLRQMQSTEFSLPIGVAMLDMLTVDPATALCVGVKSSQTIYCKVHSLYVSSRLAEGLATARDVMAFIADNWYEQPYRPVYTARVTYGQSKESDALRLYGKRTGLTVRTCRNGVNEKIPFLIASPDGLAFRNGVFAHAVEVKTIRNIRSYHGIRCCTFDGTRLTVNKSSNIYGQLQFTMAVFNTASIDLVLYFPDWGTIDVITVKWNLAYLKDYLTRLSHNYKTYLVPYLIRKLSQL